MNKIAINFENALTIAKEQNISLKETLLKLKGIGITSLDVKYERFENKEFFSDIKATGLEIGSVFAFCPLYMQNNVQKALEIVDYCASNKIKEIMLIADFLDGGYKEAELFNLKQNLRRIVKYASQYGVKVGIENVPNKNAPLATLEEVLLVLKAVKGLGLIYDGGNFVSAGDDALKAAKTLAPYVQRIHLKDRKLGLQDGYQPEITMNGEPTTVVPLGEGDSKIAESSAEILAVNSELTLVIEFPFSAINVLPAVEKSALFIHTEILS